MRQKCAAGGTGACCIAQRQRKGRSEMKPDFWNLAVRRKHGVSPEWQWCTLNSANMPEDFVQVTGAVPVGTISKGPRKGRSKWPKQLQTFCVRRADVECEMRQFEVESGKCAKCLGEGVEPFSWCKTEGTKYRPCSRCQGTGKAK